MVEGLLLSLSTLAQEFGMARETVARRLSDGGVTPADTSGAHPKYRLRDAWPALTGDAEGRADPEKMRPFERRAHYQAELEALTLATKRGELVPSFEVEQRQAEIFKAVGEFFDTLPDVLERDCGANPIMLAKVEKRLDEVREQLYTRLTEDEDADRAAG
jgi:AraC-like DNA-binding protein